MCGMYNPVLPQIFKITLITMHDTVCMCMTAVQTHLEPTEINRMICLMYFNILTQNNAKT